MNDIKNESSFKPGKRHYILCGDMDGIKVLNPIKKSLLQQSLSFEEIHLFHACSPEVDITLGRQKMGAFLYVAAEGEKLREVMSLAKKLGYSSEETQFVRVGNEKKRVFCCRCHVISVLDNSFNKGSYVTCTSCKLELELSDHYSPIKDAYLGYVAKI